MHGNVWQWTEDCYHENYEGAPQDGSPWAGADCQRVVRGGSWYLNPESLRSANRYGRTTVLRSSSLGFRGGRTLITP